MPTPDIFKMYLMKDATTFYYVDAAGVVQETATATPLEYTPDGWMDTELSWVRNMDYKGVFRSLKTEYKFVKDGAKILRKIYYEQGIEGICQLRIDIRKNTDWTYELFHKADINFKTAQDLDDYFNVSLDDDSVFSKIKSNANVDYEIPVSWDDDSILELDGINLYGSYFFAPLDSQLIFPYGTRPIIDYLQEGDFPVTAWGSQTAELFVSFPPGSDTIGSSVPSGTFDALAWLMKPYQDLELNCNIKQRIAVDQIGIVSPGGVIDVSVFVVTEDLLIHDIINLFSAPLPVGGAFTYYDINYTSPNFTVPAKAQVYIIYRILGSTPINGWNLITYGNGDLAATELENRIIFNATFKLALSYTAAIQYWRFFDRMCKKVLDTTSTVSYSTFLRSEDDFEDNQPHYTFLTCGDAIRGFQDDSVSIRTTFNDMFEDASKRWMLGLGLDATNRIILESLTYFFDRTTLIADLGEVKDLELSVAEEYFFNSLKVGMKRQQYDQLNGRDEFNQSTTYKLPFARVVKNEDWTSNYRFDMYGIELYRANLSQKKTTDSESDNDTFVIGGRIGGIRDKLSRPDFTDGGSVSGVLDTVNSYQIGLSSARQMRRNYPLLASICHLRDAESITFQTTDKNPNLVSKYNTARPTITENANIAVSDLGDPLWLPIIAEFESEVPINLRTLLATNPYGYFQFKNKFGVTIKAFMIEAGMKPATNATYRWKMILTPDNDINDLIR
jgi:hypothetical protein